MISQVDRSRHSHLQRAARSAGEAFACPQSEDGSTAPRWSVAGALVWLAVGGVAMLGLYFV
jgi:hypothetical protein